MAACSRTSCVRCSRPSSPRAANSPRPARRVSHDAHRYADDQSDRGKASANAERKSGYWNSKPASCSFFGTADQDGDEVRFDVLTRVDTSIEAEYYRHGGLLPYVLRQMLAAE